MAREPELPDDVSPQMPSWFVVEKPNPPFSQMEVGEEFMGKASKGDQVRYDMGGGSAKNRIWLSHRDVQLAVKQGTIVTRGIYGVTEEVDEIAARAARAVDLVEGR